MMTYIDQTTADDLEPDWSGSATQSDIDSALRKANVWINTLPLIDLEDIPLQIQYAGVELAKLALAGDLYKATEKVASKTVSAQSGTSVSKTFAEPLDNESRDMRYIRALLEPYIASSNHFFVDRG